MFAIYHLDMDRRLVVVLHIKSGRFFRFTLEEFLVFVDIIGARMIYGVSHNDSTSCIIEVPSVGVDLDSNTVKFVSIEVSEGTKPSTYLGLSEDEDIVGMYFILNTLSEGSYRGLMLVTSDGKTCKQFIADDREPRLCVEVNSDSCKMRMDSDSVIITKLDC